jgi:hypothetical protein
LNVNRAIAFASLLGLLVLPSSAIATTTEGVCQNAAVVQGDTPAQKCDKLRKAILCNLQPIREKFATSRQASHTANAWNALVSALGGIATGVATKNVKWIGVGTAGTGALIALWATLNSQDAQVVACMAVIDKAITTWDVSPQADADYNVFRTAVGAQVQACPELGGLGLVLAQY